MAATRCSQAWAILIKLVEVGLLSCPQCGGPMKVVAFIEPRALERSNGRGEVIEKILGHCSLWQALAPRAPPDVEDLVLDLDAAWSPIILEGNASTESRTCALKHACAELEISPTGSDTLSKNGLLITWIQTGDRAALPVG